MSLSPLSLCSSSFGLFVADVAGAVARRGAGRTTDASRITCLRAPASALEDQKAARRFLDFFSLCLWCKNVFFGDVSVKGLSSARARQKAFDGAKSRVSVQSRGALSRFVFFLCGTSMRGSPSSPRRRAGRKSHELNARPMLRRAPYSRITPRRRLCRTSRLTRGSKIEGRVRPA
jgi:hypothetical protein